MSLFKTDKSLLSFYSQNLWKRYQHRPTSVFNEKWYIKAIIIIIILIRAMILQNILSWNCEILKGIHNKAASGALLVGTEWKIGTLWHCIFLVWFVNWASLHRFEEKTFLFLVWTFVMPHGFCVALFFHLVANFTQKLPIIMS